MSPRNNSVPNISLISDDAADLAVYRALSLFIGQGRRYSCKDIEIGTDGQIKADTVQKWIAGNPIERKRPSGAKLLILQQFIGIELTNKLLSPIGQGGRSLSPEPNDPGVVVAKLSAGLLEFAQRAVDGIYCHTDRAELEDDADMIIATVTPFASRSAG